MTDWGTPTSKTVEWYDPMITAAAVSRMSGLEGTPDLSVYNPIGTVHGGRAVLASDSVPPSRRLPQAFAWDRALCRDWM